MRRYKAEWITRQEADDVDYATALCKSLAFAKRVSVQRGKAANANNYARVAVEEQADDGLWECVETWYGDWKGNWEQSK